MLGSRSAAVVAAALLACAAGAQDLTSHAWRATLDTGAFGPLETVLTFEHDASGVVGRSAGGDLELRLAPSGDGYAGVLAHRDAEASVSLTASAGALVGAVEAGPFAGTLRATPTPDAAAIRDFEAVWAEIERVIAAALFDPGDLDHPAWRTFADQMREAAASARDDIDLMLAFRDAWAGEPFSHFDIRRSQTSAAEMMASFDSFRIGRETVHLSYQGDIAVMVVDTMMGEDTIEQINAAYQDIATREPAALVIDLRTNDGGAFAVRPLVQHVIDAPLDAGYFVSNAWNATSDRLPTNEEIAALEPWQGWSILAFWEAVQSEPGLTLIRFAPQEPNFDGPVFVLTSGATASAAELAADAFRASGAATIVGERTIGRMLSQSPFDAAAGYVVTLPVADYYSLAHGRIEGSGVEPDVATTGNEALDEALRLAREATQN